MQVPFQRWVGANHMELSSHTETPSETSPDSGALSGTDDRQAVRLWLRLLGCTHRLEQALGQRLRRLSRARAAAEPLLGRCL